MSDEVFLDKKNGGYQDFEIGIVKIEKKIKVSLGYILKYWCSDFKKEKKNGRSMEKQQKTEPWHGTVLKK